MFIYNHNLVIAKTTTNYQISQHIKQARKITIDELGLGGIKLSMTEAQVKKILGKPIKVENGFIPAIGKVRTLKYADITVDLDEGAKLGNFTVYQIKTNDSKYSTINGIKVGDRQSKVFSTYGKVEPSQDGKVINLHYGVE
ncbi:MAG: hypothetical protein RMX68_020840 [Aulosira sp. ZfuVER01]|nr:hypothetical protein [Aulosira sp. ZfuVER01]MDZ8002572.1 hypothetical protein [Aulosira sp. DedVER01a]MDZ8050750.1 hypothetical protein [Aulosira sp. ZfuCHP01]